MPEKSVLNVFFWTLIWCKYVHLLLHYIRSKHQLTESCIFKPFQFQHVAIHSMLDQYVNEFAFQLLLYNLTKDLFIGA